jgi:SAM-dependent methyltransferase
VHADIERYYTAKIAAHGPTPFGVDWESVPAQELRFVQLLKICDFAAPVSFNDIGCGWGALLGFLDRRVPGMVDYLGVDLSPRMIGEARRLWPRHPRGAFVVGHGCCRVADYCVASGIFNVKLGQTPVQWSRFVRSVLADMYANSRCGFAVNFLSPLADGAAGVPELYRPPPQRWRRHCETELGGKVEVLADYGMREYTLLVRRG